MNFKLYILFLFTTTLFAQKVSTSIDHPKKKIGAEFQLTLKTSVRKNDKVIFPKAKNFGPLEVIESYPVDSIKTNDRVDLVKKYGLTQFDSGTYVIPRMLVLINGKPEYSDSIKVEVNDVKVDTLRQKMYDIKNIIPVATESPWGFYLLLLLGALGLGGLGYWLYKKYMPQKREEETITYKTPIEKATSLLQQLERKELIQRGEVKSYYSELTQIARNYIEEEIQIPAMESTTSELIVALRTVARQKKLKLTNETLENLEKVLQKADLVKFAKEKPLDFEIEEDKKRITSTIVTIHKALPEEVEDTDALEAWNAQQQEALRLLQLKKAKQKKRITQIRLVFAVLVLALSTLVYAKGFDYVKDAIFGNEAKALLEGEWILSDYGNPSITIETPEVLQRIDATKNVPKETYAILKEMQMFEFGDLNHALYIAVSTKKFKETTDINFDTVLEGFTKNWEQKGAQNILFKQETYNTTKGVSGVKAFGTMTVLNKENNSSQKMYYELLLFKQDGGLQQIMVAHREGDAFGKKILERVINSVELKISQQ
ncbi:hypothetical protein [Flavobacterium aciduliphilum]